MAALLSEAAHAQSVPPDVVPEAPVGGPASRCGEAREGPMGAARPLPTACGRHLSLLKSAQFTAAVGPSQIFFF